MKGFRTILFNALIVAGTPLLEWVVNFNWVSEVGEVWAMVIVAGANLALRWVTTTPAGQSD